MAMGGSVSEVGSNASTVSIRKNLTRKIKHKQKIISAKGTAIRNALQVKGIENNPRAIAKAGVVWATIEHTRCEYQKLLDEASDCLEEEDMTEIIRADDDQWSWLTEIETKIEELQILKDSPEKDPRRNRAFVEENGEAKFGGKTVEEFLWLQTHANLDTERKLKQQEDVAKKLQDKLTAITLGSGTSTAPR